MGRQTASPMSNAASNARCHRASASASSGPRLRHREQAGALLADQARLLRPAHDQVQAGELGGAAELQALVAGAEQRDQLPGVGGPDVPGRRERPAPRAEPFGEGAELPDHLAASGRGGELLRGREASPGAGRISAPGPERAGRAAAPAHAPADPRRAPPGLPGHHPGRRSAPRDRRCPRRGPGRTSPPSSPSRTAPGRRSRQRTLSPRRRWRPRSPRTAAPRGSRSP